MISVPFHSVRQIGIYCLSFLSMVSPPFRSFTITKTSVGTDGSTNFYQLVEELAEKFPTVELITEFVNISLQESFTKPYDNQATKVFAFQITVQTTLR